MRGGIIFLIAAVTAIAGLAPVSTARGAETNASALLTLRKDDMPVDKLKERAETFKLSFVQYQPRVKSDGNTAIDAKAKIMIGVPSMGLGQKRTAARMLVSITKEESLAVIEYLAKEKMLDSPMNLRSMAFEPTEKTHGFEVRGGNDVAYLIDLGVGDGARKALEGLKRIFEASKSTVVVESIDFVIKGLSAEDAK